jgi:NADH-quinone oxidoreductase subunit C
MFSDLLYKIVGLKKGNTVNAQVSVSKFIFLVKFFRLSEFTQTQMLIDLTAVHYLGKGFVIVYQFLSVSNNTRVCLEVFLPEKDALRIPSLSLIYPNAVWYERECYDMFGVLFEGCTDMRRILTDYGFEGYPLRKDFPCSGYVEMSYVESQKRVMASAISLAQGYRSFDFHSPHK